MAPFVNFCGVFPFKGSTPSTIQAANLPVESCTVTRKLWTSSILCLILCAAAGQAAETTQPSQHGALTSQQTAAVVETIGRALEQHYVFPQVADKMSAHIHQRLADGAYDGLQVAEICGRLTDDLREISHDLHLRLAPIPPQEIDAQQQVDEEARQARYLARARRSNYGFRKVEILPGNIGYLELTGFSDAGIGGPTAIAAMNLLAGSDALIIDLRGNGGGAPSMIQLISSYFFDEPQHLNSFFVRGQDSIDQYWTQTHVQGPKMVETPIWILTSGRTFSAAEEFTYNLKNMERATVVGETTGGGAHPVDTHSFADLGLLIRIPFGRAINPITQTNWEGTGVSPHIELPAEEALEVAHHLALEKLVSEATDADHKDALNWDLTTLRGRDDSIELTPSALRDYAGVYGPRKILFDNGRLFYQRGERPRAVLFPMAHDLFGIEGLDSFRLRFERGDDGLVSTLIGVYQNGREEPNAKEASQP